MKLLLALLAYVLSQDDGSVVLPGNDLLNHRDFTSSITTQNVAQLRVKWQANSCPGNNQGGATSTPLVYRDRVCSSDFVGCITCWLRSNGSVVWQKTMVDYGFPAGYFARPMPIYRAGVMYLGSSNYQSVLFPGVPGVGTSLLAINFDDGALLWKSQLSSDLFSVVTGSPVLEGNRIYLGLSSSESAAPLVIPGYVCCEGSGRILAVDANNGAILWNTPTIPDDLRGVGKYSGGAVWLSNMPIQGNSLYAGSGQMYQVPPDVNTCFTNNPLNGSCADRRVLFDSVIKLNKNTGEIQASVRLSAADTWNIACAIPGLPGCQTGPAHDFDITNIMLSTQGPKRVYASSKSGFFWSLDENLNIIKSQSLIPGSYNDGGFEWMQAMRDAPHFSDRQLYLANNNGGRYNWTLPDGTPVTTGAGAWIRFDGNLTIKWVTVPPNLDSPYGSPALTNDVVFGSTRYLGLLVALNKDNGQIVWSYQTSGSVSGSPAIVGNEVYWPAGPGTNFGPPTVGQTAFYVFEIPSDQ